MSHSLPLGRDIFGITGRESSARWEKSRPGCVLEKAYLLPENLFSKGENRSSFSSSVSSSSHFLFIFFDLTEGEVFLLVGH